jgi:DNA-binding transcriptional MerR regulator
MADEHLLRIGELSRRTAVSPEVLRAWERRYHLFAPLRTDGGFRLYSTADIARITAMKRLLAEGVSASEAAQRIVSGPALAQPLAEAPSLLKGRLDTLRRALLSYDETGAHATIDHLLMEFDAETVMRSAFLPLLSEIGRLWEEGRLSVADEHFASNLIRRRLSGLARGWEDGVGPRALLASPPDEEHDIPLLMFGIALGNRGWRITYLGARTPTEDLSRAVQTLHPDIVVLTSPSPGTFEAIAVPLRRLAGMVRVAIGGAGATPEFAEGAGVLLLEGDPVSAAGTLEVITTAPKDVDG